MKVDDEINDVANKREIENTKQQTTNKPKIKIPEQNYYNKSPNKLADYQLKTYRHPIGTYPGMYDVPGMVVIITRFTFLKVKLSQ